MKKTERKVRCKSILNSCIYVTSIEDFNFLLECFQLNPRIWNEKSKGQKIISIGIGLCQQYGTKHFTITREDGTITDISYIKCIDGISYERDIRNACRNAIDKTIILPYKQSLSFPMNCPVTGITLYSLTDVEIDHYDQTFEEMVKEWIKKNGGKEYLYQFINEPVDNSTVTCFTSEDIKQNFIQYHNNHTHLRAVSKEANRSILKRNRTHR